MTMTCVFDFETSGLDCPGRHEPIQLAAVLLDTDLREVGHVETKIRMTHPESADPEALAMNGYNAEVWEREAVSREDAVAALCDLVGAPPEYATVVKRGWVKTEGRWSGRFYVELSSKLCGMAPASLSDLLQVGSRVCWDSEPAGSAMRAENYTWRWSDFAGVRVRDVLPPVRFVAHNGLEFDWPILVDMATAAGRFVQGRDYKPVPELGVAGTLLDTRQIAYTLQLACGTGRFPSTRNGELARALGIDVDEGALHEALYDVRVTAEVLRRVCGSLRDSFAQAPTAAAA